MTEWVLIVFFAIGTPKNIGSATNIPMPNRDTCLAVLEDIRPYVARGICVNRSPNRSPK